MSRFCEIGDLVFWSVIFGAEVNLAIFISVKFKTGAGLLKGLQYLLVTRLFPHALVPDFALIVSGTSVASVLKNLICRVVFGHYIVVL